MPARLYQHDRPAENNLADPYLPIQSDAGLDECKQGIKLGGVYTFLTNERQVMPTAMLSATCRSAFPLGD